MNNAITFFPTVDEKNNMIEWTDNKKRSFLKIYNKRWARAMTKLSKVVKKNIVLEDSPSD